MYNIYIYIYTPAGLYGGLLAGEINDVFSRLVCAAPRGLSYTTALTPYTTAVTPYTTAITPYTPP